MDSLLADGLSRRGKIKQSEVEISGAYHLSEWTNWDKR